MSGQALDPITLPLSGNLLIEASAGTGKTYTIAALYLRLVLGHGGAVGFERPLMPDEILVMTFTRAATRELTDRIRARLVGAAAVFRGVQPLEAGDAFLRALLADYPNDSTREHAAWRLANAAEAMDETAIHTIDAWCLRMLQEHAFDSGSRWDEELVADEDALRLQAAQDYWRREVYPLPQAQLAVVFKLWSTPDALLKTLSAALKGGADTAALPASLHELFAQHAESSARAITQLKQVWAPRFAQMRAWITEELTLRKSDWDGRKFQLARSHGWLNKYQAWCEDAAAEFPSEESAERLFSRQGLLAARKDDATTVAIPQCFVEFQDLPAAAAALTQALPALLKQHAVAGILRGLAAAKMKARRFGYSDLLLRLQAALRGPQGEALKRRIRQQTPVALIDEFQDTSTAQYQVFQQIYPSALGNAAAPCHALLLIGDPKQSIYSFRNADIYSYLAARRDTAGRHYVLATNFRSTTALVDAVNAVFAHGEETLPSAAFGFGERDNNPLPFWPVAAQGRSEVLRNAQGAIPAITVDWQADNPNKGRYQAVAAMHCAEHIARLLMDARCGFTGHEGALTRLKPADIAILVRSRHEAAVIRKALYAQGLRSVYLSERENVYQSTEAADLLHWLHAVAAPLDVRAMRTGFACGLLSRSMAELHALAAEGDYFDQQAEQLRSLNAVWRQQGVLAMLRQSLHRFGLAARWQAEPNGERKLTNVLHLGELLQNMSADYAGEAALIRAYQQALTDADATEAEAQTLRLESDAELIKVLTIHVSKGLEYPVVYLPFIASVRSPEQDKNPPVLRLPNPDGQSAPEWFWLGEAEATERLRLEQAREETRLLYVAMTRARHALWLGLAEYRIGNSKTSALAESAIGRLLAGASNDSAQVRSSLEALSKQASIEVTATGDEARTLYQAQHNLPELAAERIYDGQIDRRWGLASFSQLTRGLSALQQHRAADDEPSAEAVLPRQSLSKWHAFERGPEAGNFLHQQLEFLAQDRFRLRSSPSAQARLQRAAELTGRAAQAELLQHWMQRVVEQPIDGLGASLQQLDRVLPELEFWLPIQALETSAVDSLCQRLLQGAPRPPLVARHLHGMVLGFIDLVVEHQGRYWVLDYKSNALGADDSAYRVANLQAAMAHHRYDVQASLYLLALHRHLKARLGAAYRPEQQLGGAIYYFLRGVDHDSGGIYRIDAPLELITALDQSLPAGQLNPKPCHAA